MKNKILVFTILLMFSIPFSVFGALSYSRTPDGFTIENPIHFEISFDDYYADTGITAGYDYWDFYIDLEYGGVGDVGLCLASTTKEVSFDIDLPLDTSWFTAFSGFPTLADCQNGENTSPDWDYIEIIGEMEEPIFEVVAGEPVGVITGGFEDYEMSSTTAYIGDLINSMGGFIWLIIGIPLGFWIIKETIKLITPKKVKIRK